MATCPVFSMNFKHDIPNRDPKYLIGDFQYAWRFRHEPTSRSQYVGGWTQATQKYHKNSMRGLLRGLIERIRFYRQQQ